MHAFPFDFQNGEEVLHGLLVDQPEHVGFTELADELHNNYKSDLSVASLVVIRPPVYRPLNIQTFQRESLRPVLERSPDLPLYLLGSRDFQHFISPNLNNAVQDLLDEETRSRLLTALREFELQHYALDANALLQTKGAWVFRAPSQKYCSNFIRVGSVQVNRAALEGFFFWLLPWLKDCRAIVTETWTISSIALNAARLVGRYAPESHGDCEVDMLSEYHDGSSELIVDTRAVLQRLALNPVGKVLVLISSCMSGNLVARLTNTINQCGLDVARFDFGALYSLGNAHSVNSLCDISAGIGGRQFTFSDDPPPDTEIIDIDRRTYFPLRVEEHTVRLLKPTAQLAYRFFEEYRNSGLVSVHRDSFLMDNQRFRHHAVFLDVSAVAGKSPFQERFEEKLAGFGTCPALIITPPHAAGVQLANRAQAYFKSRFEHEVPSFCHLHLNFESKLDATETDLLGRLQALKESDSILIIDDVSVTGRRLSRYQQSLRQIYAGQIQYLVGIARPEKRADWEQRVKRLRFRQPKEIVQHTVDFVEFVVLPDWDESRCPWCREHDLYKHLADSVPRLPEILSARFFRLQRARTADPLIKDAIFSLSDEAPLNLTPNSILLPSPATHADVFAAVASALQEMRTNPNNPDYLTFAFPERSVLCPEHYLGEHFNDSIIRAAVLRAARRAELERPLALREKERQTRTVETLFNVEGDRSNLSLELLLAVAAKKLPRPVLTAEQHAQLAARGYGEAVSLLLSAVDLSF